MVGVTGFEPVTLRLSSACSNQLSYTPIWRWVSLFSFQLFSFSAFQPFSFSAFQPFRVSAFRPAVEAWGFEPQTYSLQSYRSTN